MTQARPFLVIHKEQQRLREMRGEAASLEERAAELRDEIRRVGKRLEAEGHHSGA